MVGHYQIVTTNLPSRDAVDNKFQHTFDVQTDIKIRRLNSRGQELSDHMLNLMNICVNLLPSVLMNVFPSRDAVDEQFQRTLDAHIDYLTS